MKLSVTHAPQRLLGPLVIGDLEYDREDRGRVVRTKRPVDTAPAPHHSTRTVVLAAWDALVLELARRTGLPLRDVREALRDGRDAAEIGAWSPVSSREARLRRGRS